MTKAKPQKKNPPKSAKHDEGYTGFDAKETTLETALKSKEGVDEQVSKTDDMIQEPHPTEELLMLAIAGWRMHLLHPIFYFLTRTFAHYRKKEQYDSAVVFDRLRDLPIALRNHVNHVQEIDDYVDMLKREIKDYLARETPAE